MTNQNNSILTIRPYRYQGGPTWVFDDEALGLYAEAFVGEINNMIDAMLERAGLVAGEQFTAQFSASPFPGVSMILEWRSGDMGGNWYWNEDTKLEGWLCPALFKFFCQAPDTIYVRAA